MKFVYETGNHVDKNERNQNVRSKTLNRKFTMRNMFSFSMFFSLTILKNKYLGIAKYDILFQTIDKYNYYY